MITYVSLVMGELVPKALALRDPERAACLVARPIQILVRVAAWPGRFLTLSTRAVLTALGRGDTPAAPHVSEEEVKYLVREGVTHGIFEHQESELVHRVFAFTDTTVRAIMVPRLNILALDLATPPGEVLPRAAAFGRTRLPDGAPVRATPRPSRVAKRGATASRRAMRPEGGVTLVELLIALALVSVLLAAILYVWRQGTTAYMVGSEAADLQQDARIAHDRMVRELRLAGMNPCGHAPPGGEQLGSPRPPRAASLSGTSAGH